MTIYIRLWGEGERPSITGGRVKITEAAIFRGVIVYIDRVGLEPYLKLLLFILINKFPTTKRVTSTH